jgi:hypothetical protein
MIAKDTVGHSFWRRTITDSQDEFLAKPARRSVGNGTNEYELLTRFTFANLPTWNLASFASNLAIANGQK